MDKKIGCVQHDCEQCKKRNTPLSDDEIRLLFARNIEHDAYGVMTKFARAIEKAHGIGVKG